MEGDREGPGPSGRAVAWGVFEVSAASLAVASTVGREAGPERKV